MSYWYTSPSTTDNDCWLYVTKFLWAKAHEKKTDDSFSTEGEMRNSVWLVISNVVVVVIVFVGSVVINYVLAHFFYLNLAATT